MQSANQSTPPRSGCGPGASVPVDTPQEGVRGPVVTREELMERLKTQVLRWVLCAGQSTDGELRAFKPPFAPLARLHQQLADTYAALAGIKE